MAVPNWIYCQTRDIQFSKNKSRRKADWAVASLDPSIMGKAGWRRQGNVNGNVTVVFPEMERFASGAPIKGSTESSQDRSTRMTRIGRILADLILGFDRLSVIAQRRRVETIG